MKKSVMFAAALGLCVFSGCQMIGGLNLGMKIQEFPEPSFRNQDLVPIPSPHGIEPRWNPAPQQGWQHYEVLPPQQVVPHQWNNQQQWQSIPQQFPQRRSF